MIEALPLQVEHPAHSDSLVDTILQISQRVELEEIAHPDRTIKPSALGLRLAGLTVEGVDRHLRSTALQLDDIAFHQISHTRHFRLRALRAFEHASR